MEKIPFIPIDIDEEEEIVINPIIDSSTLLEKVQRRVVYIPRLRKYTEVMPKIYVLPVYIPELGALLSLDMSSKNLASRFYRETKNFEGIISRGKIFISVVHHLRPEINRMVSWGNVRSFDLQEDILRLYISNLINDFFITPALITKDGIVTPHRWFYLSSTGYFKFEAIVSYSLGIVYLKKENLLKAKLRHIWINSPMTVYEVKAGFIILYPNGHVRYIKPVFLHFTSDPSTLELISSGKGDYFLCFLISFYNYSSSYYKANLKTKCVNLVDSLAGLVLSPYDILPFLFPFMINLSDLYSLIFKFRVKKQVFYRIQNRMIKFGVPQNIELIKAFESLIKEQNKVMEITEDEDSYIVKLVNPVVIPFIIKNLYTTTKSSVKKLSERLLKSPQLISKIESLNTRFSDRMEWYTGDFKPIWGIGRVLAPRTNFMQKYIHIFRRIYSGSKSTHS